MKSSRNCHLFQIAMFTTCLSSAAVAGKGARADNDEGDGWVPVKHLEFTPDDIQGGLLGPEGERIETVLRAEQPSLIELRKGFEVEIVKTMEDM
jgi:hypothetical protein